MSTRVAGGERISPPSSRHCARCAADLLVRDASYGNLHTPPHKAVAGGWPHMVQLLVRASRCRGVIQEAMRAKEASGHTPLELARAYASMPPNEAETVGALVRWGDAAADRAGEDCATCLSLLERATAAGCGIKGGVVDEDDDDDKCGGDPHSQLLRGGVRRPRPGGGEATSRRPGWPWQLVPPYY